MSAVFLVTDEFCYVRIGVVELGATRGANSAPTCDQQIVEDPPPLFSFELIYRQFCIYLVPRLDEQRRALTSFDLPHLVIKGTSQILWFGLGVVSQDDVNDFHVRRADGTQ